MVNIINLVAILEKQKSISVQLIDKIELIGIIK